MSYVVVTGPPPPRDKNGLWLWTASFAGRSFTGISLTERLAWRHSTDWLIGERFS